MRQKTLFTRQEGTQGFEAFVVFPVQKRPRGEGQLDTAVGIAQRLAQLFDSAQDLAARVRGSPSPESRSCVAKQALRTGVVALSG